MSRHLDTAAATTTGKGATARLSSNLLSFTTANASRRLPQPQPRTPRTPRRRPAPVVRLADRRAKYDRALAERSAPVQLQVRVASDKVLAGDLVLCRTASGSYAMIYATRDANERGEVAFDADDVNRFEVVNIMGRIASFIEGGDEK